MKCIRKSIKVMDRREGGSEGGRELKAMKFGPGSHAVSVLNFGKHWRAFASKVLRHLCWDLVGCISICDRNFEVVAVVGLDEKAGRKERALREAHDALLVDAGYRVLRYARVPDVGRVEADFDPSLATPRLQLGPRFLEAMALERPAFKASTHQWHPSKARRRRRERQLPAAVQASNAR